MLVFQLLKIDLEAFLPMTHLPVGVKLGVESTDPIMPKTVNFTKFRFINALQWHIPCTILTKFSGFVGSSMTHQYFKYGGTQLEFSSSSALTLGGTFSPNGN